MADRSLQGVIDMHIHAAPDSRPRWYTGIELAEHASAAAMAGFVLKHHDRSTVPDARQVRERYPLLAVHGGLVLNRVAGGLDARIVQTELAAGAKIIWLPTRDGSGERLHRGESTPLALLTRAGEPVPALRRIFQHVAEADAVLATGHASAQEVTAILPAARGAGVRRLVVNHPEIPFLHFAADLQMRWRDEGAMLERCYPRPEAVQGFDQLAREIHAVGAEASVLATDLGRIDLPDPLAGMRQMLDELAGRGINDAELRTMTQVNPRRLLGLD